MGTRGTRGVKRELPEWTEKSIQRVLNEKYLPRAKYIVNNLYLFDWESDYWAITASGRIYECEIKISLADFKADFAHKEDKHHVLAYGYDTHGKAKNRPHFFSYAVPEPLIEKVKPLIPSYAGLVSISANGFLTIVKAPVLLHRKKFTDAELRLTDKFYYQMLTWKERYRKYNDELNKYRYELNSMRAEFKAVTGQSWKEHLKEVL